MCHVATKQTAQGIAGIIYPSQHADNLFSFKDEEGKSTVAKRSSRIESDTRYYTTASKRPRVWRVCGIGPELSDGCDTEFSEAVHC
mmetsp:Transcript_14226/g.30560  ORF Transcript_14226/g.30560 Transcript_14226/m.30560 type:complete len:86 (-) Transcript_14226:1114-1371(-)